MIKIAYNTTTVDFLDAVNKYNYLVNKKSKMHDCVNPNDYQASLRADSVDDRYLETQVWQMEYDYGYGK